MPDLDPTVEIGPVLSPLRWVTETPLRIGDEEWPVEITLTGRDSMLFRMLLARTAIHGREDAG
jgi:hypothetical protein